MSVSGFLLLQEQYSCGTDAVPHKYEFYGDSQLS